MAILARDLTPSEAKVFYEQCMTSILLPVRNAWLSLVPDPRELWPWGDRIFVPCEPYDDGGGAVVAEVRFQKCC